MGTSLSPCDLYFSAEQCTNLVLRRNSTREPKKKKTLVIPLIHSDFEASSPPSSTKPRELDDNATEDASNENRAVTEERKDPFEGVYGLIAPGSHKSGASTHGKAPMLARSRPKGWREIEDEGARLKFELEARPESDDSAYERVAIEDFGNAMLLGMGWRPGENDGAKVVELARRPERLGLGATAQLPKSDGKPSNDRNRIDPKFTKASQFIPDGTRVQIVSGEHEGMLGRIRRLSTDEREYIVELDNDEHVRVYLKEVEVYKGEKKRSLPEPRSAPQPKRYQSAEIIHEEQPTQHHSEPRRDTKLWVTPFVRVKVQSKRFRDGKYYCKKGVVEDIVHGTRCAIRLDDGQVIDDIEQADLETVIPAVGGRVMVVRGPDTGIRGVIREKDSSKQLVYVQIDDELDVLKFSMDDVAEYVA